MSGIARLIFLVVGFAIAAIATLWWLGGSAVQVRVAQATQGRVTAYIDEKARTTLPVTCRVAMPMDGRVEPVTLFPGDAVAKGDVIARMETADFESAVDEAKARLEAIQAEIAVNQYNALETTALEESKKWIAAFAELLLASGKEVDAADSVYGFAKEYEKALIDSGQAVSRIERDKARMGSAVKKVKAETSRIILNAMKIFQVITEMAPLYMEQYLKRKALNGAVLGRQLAEAEAVLARAQRNLDRTTLRSPSAGVVLQRHQTEARWLSAGSPILDIGDLDTLQSTADVLSQDVVDVKACDSVDIHGSAIGPASVHGKVLRVDPAGFAKTSSLGVEEQRVPVVIAFDDGVLKSLRAARRVLGPGFRIQVRIHTSAVEGAVRVPRPALVRFGAGWKVFKVEEGRARLVPVEVGIVNDVEAEVKSGVKQGDFVVLAPPSALSDGAKIAAQER